MRVVFSTKSDSPGYTRYFFDEPVGTGTDPVVLTGPSMKHAEGPLMVSDEFGNIKREEEREYSIMSHGQQFLDIPNEVKELKAGDKTISLSKDS